MHPSSPQVSSRRRAARRRAPCRTVLRCCPRNREGRRLGRLGRPGLSSRSGYAGRVFGTPAGKYCQARHMKDPYGQSEKLDQREVKRNGEAARIPRLCSARTFLLRTVRTRRTCLLRTILSRRTFLRMGGQSYQRQRIIPRLGCTRRCLPKVLYVVRERVYYVPSLTRGMPELLNPGSLAYVYG